MVGGTGIETGRPSNGAGISPLFQWLVGLLFARRVIDLNCVIDPLLGAAVCGRMYLVRFVVCQAEPSCASTQVKFLPLDSVSSEPAPRSQLSEVNRTHPDEPPTSQFGTKRSNWHEVERSGIGSNPELRQRKAYPPVAAVGAGRLSM